MYGILFIGLVHGLNMINGPNLNVKENMMEFGILHEGVKGGKAGSG